MEIDRGLDDCDVLLFLTLLLSIEDVIEKVLSALDLVWEDEGLK